MDKLNDLTAKVLYEIAILYKRELLTGGQRLLLKQALLSDDPPFIQAMKSCIACDASGYQIVDV